MVFVKEDIPIHREHTDLTLEHGARLREGAERPDQARLDPVQEVQSDRDSINIHMINDLDQGGIDPGAPDCLSPGCPRLPRQSDGR